MAYRLKPVDYFAHDIVGADSTYLYRVNHSGGGSFQRIPKTALASAETLTAWGDMPGDPYVQWARFSTGTQLIICDVGGTPTVCRSTDGGATWTAVQGLNAQPLRGILIATVSGAERAIIGEYRTSGSGGEDVVLWQSTDDGVTWTALNTWGYQTETRHIHCTVQDPYTGYIYIGFGDTDDQSGIIRWDPLVGDWADVGDTAPKDVSATGFIGIGGKQIYRCTDIVFDSDYAYHFADAGGSAEAYERGIFRLQKDLTRFERLNNDIEGFSEYAGYWCVMTARGPVFINYVATTDATDAEISIWQFGHNTCELVGQFNCHDTAATKNPRAFFVDGDNIYLSVAPAGGKSTQKGTAVFTVTSERFTQPWPDIVHPVFWVSKGGVDTATGYDPRVPLLTIAKALSNSSNVIPYGAGVLVGEGAYSAAGFTMGGFASYVTSFPTEAGAFIQVRGDGAVSWNFASGTNGLTLAGEDNLNLRLNDLTVTATGITGSMILGSAANYGTVLAHNCTLGDLATNITQTVYPRSTRFDAYRSHLMCEKSVGNYVIRLIDASPVTESIARVFSSIVEGGYYGVDMDNDVQLEVYNSVIKDSTVAGVITRAGLNNQPIIENTVMHSDSVAWTPFDDDNSMTYTRLRSLRVDKSSSTDGVADAELGAGSEIVAALATAGEVYVDPENNDYTPVDGSLAGCGMAYRFGYDGQTLKNPPAIGPVEYQSGLRPTAGTRTTATR